MDILTAQNLAEEIRTAPSERLKEWSEMKDIFFSYPSLIRLQGLINSGKANIGADELCFLNEVAHSLSASPMYYSAGSVTTKEKDIADTLADMMSKYAFFNPQYSSPCSLEEAFRLGKKAVEYKKTKSFSMGDLSLFSADSDKLASLGAALNGLDESFCENGICVANDQYIKKEKRVKSNKKYLISFVSLTEDSEFDALLDFAKAVPQLKGTILAFADERYKLFAKILEHSKKLSVITEHEPLLLSITDFLFNRELTIAVISKKSAKKRLESLALKKGVEIHHPIKITKQSKINVVYKNTVLTSFSYDILKNLMLFSSIDVNIPNQLDSWVSLPDVGTYKSEKTAESVYMTSVSLGSPESAFLSSINALVSPFISAACDGKCTKNSEFSITVNAKFSTNAEDSYAALLGIYRAITEIGVVVENPSITFTDSEPSVSVALKVSSFGEISEVSTSLSREDLYSYLLKDNKIPDFAVLRDLINGKKL